MEDSRQSSQHGMALLLHRRKVTADAAKSGDPSRTTKGARNLLLHFGPAKVPLRLIIRKRNPQIVEQSQHLLCSQEQAQVAVVEQHTQPPESRNSARPSRRAR